MLVSLLAGLLLVVTASPAGAQGTTEFMRRLEKVTNAYRDGRYAEALAGSRGLIAQFPEVAELWLWHGSIAEYMGEFDEALAAFNKARLLAPSAPKAHYRLGGFLVRLGEYDQALTHLDWMVTSYAWDIRWKFLHGSPDEKAALVKEHPSLEYIAQLKIDILMEKGDLETARRLAREFGIVQPNHDYCGQARQRAGQPTRETLFKTQRLAALSTPPDPDCVWWYGQWLADEGYVRLAQRMVIEGTRLTPSAVNKASGERYLRVRLSGGRPISKRAEQLAMIARQRYVREGDRDGAVGLLQEAIRLEPTFARPYMHMARITWEGGDRGSTLAWLERAIKADPDCWRAHRNLGQALERLGRFADAELRLRTAVELFGDDVGGRLMLARALYAQGKFEAYVRETRQALQFAQTWSRNQLPEVREFLATYERAGAGSALPPAPDPRVLIGWNQD